MFFINKIDITGSKYLIKNATFWLTFEIYWMNSGGHRPENVITAFGQRSRELSRSIGTLL